jgi:hypothetical protein
MPSHHDDEGVRPSVPKSRPVPPRAAGRDPVTTLAGTPGLPAGASPGGRVELEIAALVLALASVARSAFRR